MGGGLTSGPEGGVWEMACQAGRHRSQGRGGSLLNCKGVRACCGIEWVVSLRLGMASVLFSLVDTHMTWWTCLQEHHLPCRPRSAF